MPLSAGCADCGDGARRAAVPAPSRPAPRRSRASSARAAVVRAAGGGLVGLWLAYSVWILARFVTLVARARGSRWLVTGAVRL
ncbi:MAG: hypothetical protein ACLPUO_20550 [Streptosporangiaceae bacterium]